MRKLRILHIVFCCLAAVVLHGQAQSTKAVKIGTTPAIRDIANHTQTFKSKVKALKKKRPIPNFIGRKKGYYHAANPKALPQGPDPIRQNLTLRSTPIDIEPLHVLEGMGQEVSPYVPDPAGDKSPEHYMQIINATHMMLWNNDGERLLSEPFQVSNLWTSLGKSSGGDPIVLYDRDFDRWIITEFPPSFSAFLLVAVSKTNDPLGEYDVYEFGTPNFPDYPKYALWNTALVVTTNESSTVAPVYAINRQQLMDGAEEVDIQRTTVPKFQEPSFQVITPIDLDGATPAASDDAMIIRMSDDAWGGTPDDRLEIYTFHIDWDDPNNSGIEKTDSITVSPFDSEFCSVSSPFSFSCVPQPNGQGIDAIKQTIMNQVHYRRFAGYEAMTLCHTTDVTGDDQAGIRWYELRRTDGVHWVLHQEGTFAPDDDNQRFIPAIAMDGVGNIGLAYTVSSSQKFPSIRFTGRKASDPLGMMTVTEQEVYTGGGSISTDRFGDYAGMVVDPANEKTFWFTGEYVKEENSYGTAVLAFELGQDTFDLAVAELLAPVNGDDLDTEDIVFSVSNTGLEAMTDYTVGYDYLGSTGEQMITGTLQAEESDTVTFTDAISIEGFDPSQLKVWVSSPSDQNVNNDTLLTLIRKLPEFDLAIVSISGEEEQVCSDSTTLQVNVRNLGTKTIEDHKLEYSLNGGTPDTLDIASIAAGGTAKVDVPLSGLIAGDNGVAFALVSSGSSADQIAVNNESSTIVMAEPAGVGIEISLDLDAYPYENSYIIYDSLGKEVVNVESLSGRERVEDRHCIANGCYSLVIFDSFNDGIFDDPDLNISLSGSGEELIKVEDLNFSDSFIVEFCTDGECVIDVDVQLSDLKEEGADDGIILISAMNVSPEAQYSIDDGVTWSSNNLFTNLAAGTYQVWVQDMEDCGYKETVNLSVCNVGTEVEVFNASGSNSTDGSILVKLDRDDVAATFELDGSDETQDNGLFADLSPGYYTVKVIYGNACVVVLDSIRVGNSTSTSNITAHNFVKIYPNPTDGVFRVEVAGVSQKVILPYTIYDLNGRAVQHGRLPNYDGKHVGNVSIKHLASGMYLLNVGQKGKGQMRKIIKQ